MESIWVAIIGFLVAWFFISIFLLIKESPKRQEADLDHIYDLFNDVFK